MASITPTAKGYRVQVYVKGVRDSASFRTKREAEAWAARRETELREAVASPAPPGQRVTLREVMARYGEEVSPTKRGCRWELLRLGMLGDMPELRADEPVAALSAERLGQWRDARLRTVQSSTVIREANLLGALLEHARREWRLIDINPMRDMRRPRAPDHREIVITRRQIRAMLKALDYRPSRPPTSARHAVAASFLVALRTGMRAGEIAGLQWSRVHGDYCSLDRTKTTPRKVPLPYGARRVIEWMRGWDDEYVFGVGRASLDALFRKYRDRAGLSGFTFHDSRHTAATWLARRLDVLDLCKMFGWKSPKQALTYYNPTASDIAQRLTSGRRPVRDQSR